MLETVREYALERLVQRGQEATLHERHVSCFLRIIETTEHMDIDPGRVQLLRRVDDEVHNVRAVLDWAMRHDVQGALLLTAIMLEWLISHGSLTEGLRIIREVFALPTASVHTIPRARALWAAGTLMFHRSDMDSAQAYIAESLVLSQELNYDRGEAAALIALGRITNRQSYDQSSARLDQERALSIYRASGDVGYIAYALVLLAQTYMFQGDFLRARALCEKSLAVAQQAGFRILGHSIY